MTGDPRLEILLADYTATREDERTSYNYQITAVSIAVALLGLVTVAITQVCDSPTAAGPNPTPTPSAPAGSHGERDCVELSPLFLAGTPFAPMAVLGYLLAYGAISTIRSYYLRALEREIRRYITEPLLALKGIGPATSADLLTQLTSFRRGRPSVIFLYLIAPVAALVIFGGLSVDIAQKVSPPYQIGMAMVYLPIVAVMVYVMGLVSFGGRRLFQDVAERYVAQRHELPKVRKLPAARPERSLGSYLLVPRPEDWFKWLVFGPAIFLFVGWVTGSLDQAPRYALLWAAFDLMIYTARYQWNDIRGVGEDARHPEYRSRARLPLGRDGRDARRNVTISAVVAAARLAAAVVIGWGGGLLREVLWAAGLVFGAAAIYEWLRTLQANGRRLWWVVVAIWAMVGPGYALRAAAAMWMAAPQSGLAWFSGTVYFASLGIMFVLLIWALEATSHCRRDDQLRWHGTPELAAKPHVAVLLRFVGIRPDPPDARLPDDRTCGDVRILEARGVVLAPWNAALVLASAAGAPFCAALLGISTPSVWALAAAGILPASALCLMPNTGSRVAVALLGVGPHVAVAWWLQVPPNRIWITVAPWLVVAATYLSYRASSYRAIKYTGRRILALGTRVASRAVRILVGRRTWELLTRGSRHAGDDLAV
jgi:hypothetical protein